MSATLIIVASVVALVVLAGVLLRGPHPENAAGHSDTHDDTTNHRFYDGVDRPAGPDAEGNMSGRSSPSE